MNGASGVSDLPHQILISVWRQIVVDWCLADVLHL